MRFDAFDAYLCDLDGCLIAEDTLLPGAAELIALAGDRLRVFSNNSTQTPATLSLHLARLGLDIPAERILLAGAAAVEVLARRPGIRLAVYGSAALRAHARSCDLDPAAEAPTHVLVTGDRSLTCADLHAIVAHAARGAAVIGANPDASRPGPDGIPIPETGALLAAIRTVLPDIRISAFGKPSGEFYRYALDRTGPGRRVLAIGDTPETDGLGARRMGLPVAIVGSASQRFASLPELIGANPDFGLDRHGADLCAG